MRRIISVTVLAGLLSACSSAPVQQPIAAATADTVSTIEPQIIRREVPIPDELVYDFLLAEFALRQGDYRQALRLYQDLATQVDDVEVSARATRIAQFLGDESAVSELVKRWLAQEPNNPEAGRLAGILALRRGAGATAFDYFYDAAQEGAIVDFGMLARAYPDLSSPEREILKQRIDAKLDGSQERSLTFARALMAAEDGDNTRALTFVNELLAAEPQNIQALMLQARLQLSLKHESPLDGLGQAVKTNPNNEALRQHYAQLLAGTDVSAARTQYEILSADHPRKGEYLMALALLNKELNDFLAAKAYLRQCLALEQLIDEAHYYLGEIAQQEGALQAAMDHYQQVGDGQHFLIASRRVAAMLLQTNQLQELHAYLENQRTRFPRRGEQLFALEAQVLSTAEEDEATVELLNKALAAYPNSESLRYARAMAAQRLGNLAQLEADLRIILSISPNNATVLNALGYTLADQTNRYEEAFELISKALELAPGEPAILDSMGWVLFKLGRLQEAEQQLQLAYQQMQDPEIAAHLGEVLMAMGRAEEATKLWTAAIEAAPQHQALIDTLKRLQPALLVTQ